MKRYQYFLIIFFLTCFQLTTFAKPVIRIEPPHVQMDEPFNLIITAENISTSNPPDLKPLQQYFKILGTQRTMSYSIVNGQTTSLGQWIILLQAKQAGKLTIPSIQLGQEQTDSITIDVADSATLSTEENTASNTPSSQESKPSPTNDVFLKTTISVKQPYINQQTLYTVRLYSNKQLLDAEYQPPTVEDAVLVPIGNGRHYQKQLNNQVYAVDEQQYAIFAQKSGVLKIKPPSFKGVVYDAVPRQLHLKAQNTAITIRPIPSEVKDTNWFPAKKVILSETLDLTQTSVHEGDSLTRVITLQAVQVPGQLIPTIAFKSTDDYGVYPENPEVKNAIQSNELIGTSTIKINYIFNKAGTITIPALEVPWFNTATNMQEIATLPAHTYQVKSINNDAKTLLQPTRSSNKTESKTAIQPPLTKTASLNTLIAVAIGFASACGLFFILWILKKCCVNNNKHNKKYAIKLIQDACKKNDAPQARQAFILFATTQWPEAKVLNLHDVATLCKDIPLKKHLTILGDALYNTKQSHSWKGTALLQAFHAYLKMKPVKKEKSKAGNHELPPINPK